MEYRFGDCLKTPTVWCSIVNILNTTISDAESEIGEQHTRLDIFKLLADLYVRMLEGRLDYFPFYHEVQHGVSMWYPFDGLRDSADLYHWCSRLAVIEDVRAFQLGFRDFRIFVELAAANMWKFLVNNLYDLANSCDFHTVLNVKHYFQSVVCDGGSTDVRWRSLKGLFPMKSQELMHFLRWLGEMECIFKFLGQWTNDLLCVVDCIINFRRTSLLGAQNVTGDDIYSDVLSSLNES